MHNSRRESYEANCKENHDELLNKPGFGVTLGAGNIGRLIEDVISA